MDLSYFSFRQLRAACLASLAACASDPRAAVTPSSEDSTEIDEPEPEPDASAAVRTLDAAAPPAVTPTPKADAAITAVDAAPSPPAEPARPQRGDAIARAYAALTHNDKAAIDGVLVDLDRDLQAAPDDGYTAFFTGTMRLWKISELSLGLGDLIASPSLVDEILSRLERARVLSPEDFRVPGFLGLAQVNAGLLGSDSALVDKGLATLDQAIDQFPAYGHFLRACSTAGLAKDDPRFAQALDDMEKVTVECALDVGDAQTAFRYPAPPIKAPSPHVCMDDGIVPHAFEGFFILYGDLANKAGWPAERVRALYRSAQTAPGYASWPFADLLEERISKVEESARLLTDANPLNDPLLWVTSGHICTGCHQD